MIILQPHRCKMDDITKEKKKKQFVRASVSPHLSLKALIVFKHFLCKNDEHHSSKSFKGSVLVEKMYI